MEIIDLDAEDDAPVVPSPVRREQEALLSAYKRQRTDVAVARRPVHVS